MKVAQLVRVSVILDARKKATALNTYYRKSEKTEEYKDDIEFIVNLTRNKLNKLINQRLVIRI